MAYLMYESFVTQPYAYVLVNANDRNVCNYTKSQVQIEVLP